MKKIYLLFAVIIFCLFSFNAVFCEGKLADKDAYNTYIGKSVSQVTGTVSGTDKPDNGWYLADLAAGEDGKYKALLFHADETGTIDKTAFVCERTITDLSMISVFDGLRAAVYVAADYLGFGGADVMMELMMAPQTDENSYSISFEYTDITCKADPGSMTDLIPSIGGSPADPLAVYNVICSPGGSGDMPAADEVWDYEILADNTARITGYTGSNAEIVVPDSLDGHPVSSIFMEYDRSWPSSLNSVVLPEGLTTVEEYTFMSCGSLEKVVFPSSLQHIGDRAFYSCNALTRINLPEGLVSLGNSAFSYCSALETISLPSTLTEIGEDIFSCCDNLKFISVSSKNPLLSVKNNSLYKQEELLIYPSGMPFDFYEVEEGTSVIGSYAFYGNDALTSVLLPEGITAIRNGAFQGCKKLTSFTVPDGVVSIGKDVFTDCYDLRSLYLPGSLEEIDDKLFGVGVAPDDLVITAESGSYAHQWAEEKGYDVIAVPSGGPEEVPEPAAPSEPPAEPEPPVMPEPTVAPEPTEVPEPTGAPEPPAAEKPESDGPEPLKAGDTLTLGLYEQDEVPGTDPIEWQVLAVEDDRALLISRYGLEIKKYNDEKKDVTWETCTLRAWLNGEFFNSAFDEKERSNIIEVTNTNPGSSKWETNGGNDTRDRVFLLNQEEAEKYFADNSARSCSLTYYVQQKGAPGFWWLRSAGYESSAAETVFTDGYIFELGDSVDIETNVVRPALWLDLIGMIESQGGEPPSEPEAPSRPTGMPGPDGAVEPEKPEGPHAAEGNPESADNSLVVVNADYLRSDPVPDAAVVRSVLSGTTVEKLGERTVDGLDWVRIRTPQGQTGWIQARAFE